VKSPIGEGQSSQQNVISERLVYEDIYTSFHIRKYEIHTDTTSQGSAKKITKEIPHLEEDLLRNLDRNGVIRLGSWVETGDILVGKLTPQMASESSYIAEAGLLRAIFGLEVSTSKETSLKLPIGGRGCVIDVKWIQRDPLDIMVRVYILHSRLCRIIHKRSFFGSLFLAVRDTLLLSSHYTV
jgi:DNA-directed RNA polymerase subunit beta